MRIWWNWNLNTLLVGMSNGTAAVEHSLVIPHNLNRVTIWLGDSASKYCACSATQSCLTLYDPMDCSLPGFSVHGIFQARILEQIAISSSKGSSRPRVQTCISCVSCIARGFFVAWAIGGSLLLGTDQENWKTLCSYKNCTQMYTAALFTIAQVQIQSKCPSTEK